MMASFTWLSVLVITTMVICNDGFKLTKLKGDKKVEIRQNYHAACEASVNGLISKYLTASYGHLLMAAHFDRPDVALSGFYDFCTGHHYEKGATAMKLIRYQNSRGGTVNIKPNPKAAMKWTTAKGAMKAMLEMEKHFGKELQNAYIKADSHNDVDLKIFLGKLIESETKHIAELGHYVTHLKHIGDGNGIHEFNLELIKKYHSKTMICNEHLHT